MSSKGKTWKRPNTPTVEEFYNARVVHGDGCWAWVGRTDTFGYGVIQQNRKIPRKSAHRVSWEIHNGPIPDGLSVLHHCDNPPCTNPKHLFLGTQADNLADAKKKGRLKNPDKGWQRTKTHCSNGHEFSEQNTYKYKNKRVCRACHVMHERNRRLKIRTQDGNRSGL